MIYIDTSVVLAELLAEDVRPEAATWTQTLVSSRLLQYETWVRLHARRLAGSYGEKASALISRVNLVELSPEVLDRVLEPFPIPLRTLDALHVATIEYLRGRRIPVSLLTFDRRQATAAAAMGITLAQAG